MNRIRAIREDNNLTQDAVAQYLHCDQSLYSKYERGMRDVPMKAMIALSEYYKVSVDYLLGLTDNPKRNH